MENSLNCIQRYSALVVGSCLDDLIVVSGTVFNEILLWHVQDESAGSQSHAIRVSYVGHQVN